MNFFLRKKIIVNHGGLYEWEREKLSFFEKKYARFNHKIAAKFATINITDNDLYKKSLKENFGVDAVVIRYGGDHVKHIEVKEHPELISKYPFVNEKYAVSVSRAQIDNNLHIVLKAFETFDSYKLVLISNWEVSIYGRELYEKYKDHPNIILLRAIYDKESLDFIRGNGYVYIHTHSRCGTAPSLVEAMNLGKAIISYDVPTNRETTHDKAMYFTNADDLRKVLNGINDDEALKNGKIMYDIASKNYTWDIVSNQYLNLIKE
jgi:glycosyltransferase involved in cell wall biosynthesis